MEKSTQCEAESASSASELGSGSEKVFQLLQEVLNGLQEEGALDDGGGGGSVTNWKHPAELMVCWIFYLMAIFF